MIAVDTVQPKLQFLHAEGLLNAVKLAQFRRFSMDELKFSLHPGQSGCLKTRWDGTVLDGHHRLRILIERDESVHVLQREIINKQDHGS